ncbi:hypothetical protein O0I10_001557 [Lichtheimia ornata]|uniref:Uncharacterized protein n=1 Tax=Lichtheimia ornata TaxID=688661 RepID=A0AAD7VCL4_9FUNG|nr:uncharacterized protein O0I10_001557 [Lichtheimia ornata]KAJ8662595.1 hypothetical protein O0I10_001557 [Lichtheimia ornata]
MESSVYVVHLSGLPLMKRDDLAIAIRDNMYRYGHVLDVKVCTDEFNLLTGKGSVLLDTSPNDREDPISALEHEIHMETGSQAHRFSKMARHGYSLQLLQEGGS